MPVEFKDKKGVDIEPGDKVTIIKEVEVQTVQGTREGVVLTYADGQNGRVEIACDQVEKTGSRV
jgi:uncharacterized Zn ribbon protein